MASQAERLSRLEEKVDGVAEDVREIKDILKNLDSKFASKWVETALRFAAGAFVVGLFGGLFYWVFAIAFGR